MAALPIEGADGSTLKGRLRVRGKGSVGRSLSLVQVLLAAFLAPFMYATTAQAQDSPSLAIVPQIPHTLPVSSVAFAPNGVRVLSGSDDKTVKLWDASTGQHLRTFEGHTDGVSSVVVAPDGTRVLSGSKDRTMKLWDARTGELLRTFKGHSGWVRSVAFAPDGARVISGSDDRTVKLWDANTGRPLRTFKGHSDVVTSVAFGPDGVRVLSGSGDKTVKLWDTGTGKLLRTFKGHSAEVRSVAFASAGDRVLSGSFDKMVTLWDTGTGRLLRTFKGHSGVVTSVAFAPDGARLLSGGEDRTVKMWDSGTGQLIRTFEGHSAWVSSVAFAPDGARVLSGSGDYVAKLWDAGTGQLVRIFEATSGAVSSVALAPDGTRVLSGNDDNTVRLWDALTGRLLRTFEGHSASVSSVAFAPEGARVLSGSDDNTVKLWDAATGRLLRTFEGRSAAITSVAFAPDGARALAGSWDNTVTLWEAETGQLLRTLQGHSGWVMSVAFTPDGARVLSGSADNTAKLWDAGTGQLLLTFQGHSGWVRSVAVAPDGARVLSGSDDKTVKLWNAATGQLLRTFEGHSVGVSAVAFTPDGAHVLSGSGDKMVKLWDAGTGRLLRTFEAHSGSILSVALAPDGTRMVSGSSDTTVRLWNLATGQLLASLLGSRNGELAITPAGFFAASRNGSGMLSVVRGLEAYSVMQFYDHLHRPDLVEEALKRDPEGKHKDAAFNRNLEIILDSGPAPQIDHIEKKTERAGDTIRLAVRIIDTGGGIGARVVWRVNGQTQGDVEPTALKGAQTPSAGRAITLTETFLIDPSRVNAIELTAYNGKALVATPPFLITVDKFGAIAHERPRMHVLAIGVDKYRMPDYELKYAVKDTLEFSKALELVGSSLFAKVHTMALTNEEVSERAIATAFDRIGADAKIGDVFVLFLAGHGKSIEGKYYYYPQTIDFRAGQTVERHGISQAKWQSWLAKVGHVQKSMLILDTCESGAAVGLIRGGESSRQAAMDNFKHATGHNLIAAARQAAFEGYQGHGVLTYALLEALHKQAGDSIDDSVKVGSLADYVDARVPAITQQLFGQYQRPIRILSGNDFPIGIRQAVLRVDDGIPKTPTHVVIRAELVRQRPSTDSHGEFDLLPGADLRVVEFVGDWAIIARDGQKLGYVPAAALARRH